MTFVTVVAKAVAKPDDADALEKALLDLLSPTLAEPGCRHYVVHRGLHEPEVLIVVEEWESEAALDLHLASAHIAAFAAAAEPLLAAPVEITRLVAVTGTGTGTGDPTA